MPSYDIGALILIFLYAVQAEVRFGARARAIRAGTSDRNSTLALSLASLVPILGLVLTIKARSSGSLAALIPDWFGVAILPEMPAAAWLGVGIGICGLAIRLWAVLTLRERYTRTLLLQEQQVIESKGPYRWVRHPGYLGSLFCLNGVALASGNWIVLVASLLVTYAAYSYRINAEEKMLVAGLGRSYDEYRQQVGRLIPKLRG